MHPSSYNTMADKARQYFADLPGGSTILDFGAQCVNGSYRALISPRLNYVGLDLALGSNVDMLMVSEFDSGLPDESVDGVISGQCLEHCRNPFKLVAEMGRVCRPGKFCIIIAPFVWPEHRYPVDCWRFLPDGMRSLFEYAGLSTVEAFISGKDCVGVARK